MPVWLKPLNFYLHFSRPINGTAMNCAIIDVGFSQRVKDQQKCGFSQIKPFMHLRPKAEIKYIDNDNLICTHKLSEWFSSKKNDSNLFSKFYSLLN